VAAFCPLGRAMRKLGFVRRLETLKQDTKMNIRHLTIAILATSSSLIMPVAAQPPDMNYWLGRKYGILEKQVDGEYKPNTAAAPDYTPVPKADVRQAQRTCTTTCSPCSRRRGLSPATANLAGQIQ
jgi:hypothetical protein